MASRLTERRRMIKTQLIARDITDPLVLKAMEAVPREAFVPQDLTSFAYRDRPLPIGSGQTISQPYIVALMIQALALKGGEKVLEIGAGSGYAAAVLGRIAQDVYAIERIEALAAFAKEILARAGISNVKVRCGDGTLGWPEAAPFDAILVSAGGPAVPEALKEQLSAGGRLVIPVGEGRFEQDLLRVTRTAAATFTDENLGGVRFVPLLGEEGWAEDVET